MPLVPFRIVNAIRCRATQRIRWKVVIVDFLSFLTPCLAIVFELSNEFFLLRIHADSRLTAGAEVLTLGCDVPELLIAFDVCLFRVQHFVVAAQTVLLLTQQTTDCRRTGAVIQLLG